MIIYSSVICNFIKAEDNSETKEPNANFHCIQIFTNNCEVKVHQNTNILRIGGFDPLLTFHPHTEVSVLKRYFEICSYRCGKKKNLQIM